MMKGRDRTLSNRCALTAFCNHGEVQMQINSFRRKIDFLKKIITEKKTYNKITRRGRYKEKS